MSSLIEYLRALQNQNPISRFLPAFILTTHLKGKCPNTAFT